MHGDEEEQASDVIERVGKHSDDEFAMLWMVGHLSMS